MTRAQRCPCCKFRTLSERGGFEICPVCFWEDDGQDEHDADVVRGGPNGSLSLRQAQLNYQRFGASEETFVDSVRPPMEDERRCLAVYFTRTTACFFLPNDSFTTPSESRSAVMTLRFSSSITASFRRAPPPLIRRRASPLLATRPVRRSSS